MVAVLIMPEPTVIAVVGMVMTPNATLAPATVPAAFVQVTTCPELLHAQPFCGVGMTPML
jgi:hypothetical protein